MGLFRRVSFTALLRRALLGTFDPFGRSTWTELAVAFIAAMVFVPLMTLALMLAGGPTGSLPILALNVLSALPFPALLARRIHDHGRSGWWALLGGVSFGLWLARSSVAALQSIEARIALDRSIWPLDWIAILANLVLIVLLVLPGTPGPNRFGPDPRDAPGRAARSVPRSGSGQPVASPWG